MQDVTTLPLDEALVLPREEAAVAPAPARSAFRQYRPVWDVGLKALLLFMVAQLWVVQGYKVFGSCMEPNLNNGERLLGSKLAMVTGIHRGDVVVFQPPHKPQTAFIKRVVGLPGELLEIRNNQVFVNGKRLNEPYLQRVWHDERPAERIAKDMVFVMGDNRDNSNDSRMWGELPLRSITAKAWLRYWPLQRAGLIR